MLPKRSNAKECKLKSAPASHTAHLLLPMGNGFGQLLLTWGCSEDTSKCRLSLS